MSTIQEAEDSGSSWHLLISPLSRQAVHSEEYDIPIKCNLLVATSRSKLTLMVDRHPSRLLTTHPFAPLLFPNLSSDARDHCANERTFLSWLRLSIFMAVVSVAVVITFHLKNEPTEVEKRYALPFGLIFWLLSLACLTNGLANYLNTIKKYANRTALVQSGWKTQMVFILVAITIVAACILFLSTNQR